MGEPLITHKPEIYLKIEDGPDIGHLFDKFEWKSFTNGGYIIRAKVVDAHWNIIRDLATKFYLNKGRRQPTPVIYEIKYADSDFKTGKHLAYITDLDTKGVNFGGVLDFVAVDPPSYWLNAGDSSGKVYKGKVGGKKGVIYQTIEKYFIIPNGKGKAEVSETKGDDEENWWMMRMDPKTFISSLIDWSASITNKKTNWIVSSDGNVELGEPEIFIKEQGDKKSEDYGMYVLDSKSPAANDSLNFEFLSDNFISVFQKQLITHGISAISGLYLDRKFDINRKKVHVYDENTDQKKNVDIDAERGFAKPSTNTGSPEAPHEWSTAVMAIPEFNAGDLGLKYSDYIDGRARGLFLNMLNLVMRIKLRVLGEWSNKLASSHNLGVSKLKIAWIDADNKVYFLEGDWLVYGFHHVVRPGDWTTDLYCARLDWDSSAQKV